MSKVRHLVILGQTVSQKWGLGQEIADTTDTYINAPADDGKGYTCEMDNKTFHLPAGHKPYMVLSKGGTGPFSCANCVAMYKEGSEYHCKSPDYAAYMGGSLLVDEDGAPLKDPTKACSDWFSPKK